MKTHRLTTGFLKLVFDEGVYRSWWVWLFLLLCFAVYERSASSRYHHFESLRQRQLELTKDIAVAEREGRLLAAHVASRSDPLWVELALMRRLGMVPVGAQKVYFTERESDEYPTS